MLDAELLSILACPVDKGELWYFEAEEFLYNPRLRRKYPIQEGIPILLADAALLVDDAEAKDLEDKHGL